MIKTNKKINGAKVAIFGLTFKENTLGGGNTKVIDVIYELQEYGLVVLVVDPQAEKEEVSHKYGLNISKKAVVKDVDTVIFAVPHNEFKDINLDELKICQA